VLLWSLVRVAQLLYAGVCYLYSVTFELNIR